MISNNPNNHPIGIFDSGVGGLSIAKCIAEHLPNENLLYVADSANAPYGDISIENIQQRVNVIADWLVDKGCKAIVIACNTATVNAIDQLRERLSIPIIGVEPAIKPAAKHSQKKRIAILVTQATAINHRFLQLVKKHKNGAEVIIQPCLGLVELIESGQHQSKECHSLLNKYLMPLKEKSIDTLVLGCTHYPFVKETIKTIVGSEIEIMDTALPVTKQLILQLNKYQIQSTESGQFPPKFYSSLANSQQETLFSQLWKNQIKLNKLL